MSSLLLLGEFLGKSQELEFDLALGGLVDKILAHFHCEAASIWLADQGELEAVACAGPVSILGIRVDIEESRVGSVYQKQEVDYFHTKHHEGVRNRSVDQSSGFETRDLLTVPICWGTYRFGALQLVNSTWRTGIGFRKDDIEAVEVFGAALGAALLNKDLAEKQTQSALLQRDLKQAQEAQQLLFPEITEKAAGVVLPYRGLSGDFYDYWTHNGNRYFVFGDVAGKGVQAAITVSRILGMVGPSLRAGDSLEAVVDRLNSHMIEGLQGFCTFVVGVINGNGIRYINCGHAEVFLCGIELTPLSVSFPPIGVAEFEYHSEFMGITPVVTHLVAASDGLSEYRGEAPKSWSPLEDRIKALDLMGLTPIEIAQRLVDPVEQGTFPQHDDTSVLCLKL